VLTEKKMNIDFIRKKLSADLQEGIKLRIFRKELSLGCKGNLGFP
jgi:hypothetical protein